MCSSDLSSILIGASRPEQIADNVAALELALTPDQTQRLQAASAPLTTYPTTLFNPLVKRFAFGGAEVEAWRPG